LEDLDADHPCK